MAKRERNKDDYIDMNVDTILLDDEIDINTGEDLPDDNPELTESMIGGEVGAKETLQELYKSLKFVYGKYNPNHLPMFNYIVSKFVPLLFMFTSYAVCIWQAVIGNWNNILIVLLVIGTIFPVVALWFLRKPTKSVWWWKYKGKTISVYQDNKRNGKGDIVIYVNQKYMWHYDQKTGEWQENDLIVMGSRLLFNHMKGELRIKKKRNGETEIGSYTRGRFQAEWSKHLSKKTFIRLKNGNPLYIDHWSYRGPKAMNVVTTERFFFKEINTDRYVEIPRSFIDFCKEKGIESLEENEHLHYV